MSHMRLPRFRESALWPESQSFPAGESEMDNFESLVSLLDFTLNSKRKRHIVGGILLSVSCLFAGLALTAMTLPKGEEKREQSN